MNKVLIVEACYYPDISELLLDAAKQLLEQNGIDYEKIKVPGIFEIPSAISIALDSFDYDGIIALGCIINDPRTSAQIIFHECARGINDLAIHFSLPTGFGVMLVDNKELAVDKAKFYAKQAAESCLELIKIKNLYQTFNSDNGRGYKN